MKYHVRVLVITILGAFLLACSSTNSVDIRAMSGVSADFSNYKTYFVLPIPPDKSGTRQSKTFPRQTVEAAVRSELAARNYTEITTKEEADMLVAIQFSLEDKQRLKKVVEYDTQIVNYGGYSYGYGYQNYYGYRTIPHTSIRVDDFRQGNMVIDLIDREDNAMVWQGFARGEGKQKLAAIEKRINSVVKSMFEQYQHFAAEK